MEQLRSEPDRIFNILKMRRSNWTCISKKFTPVVSYIIYYLRLLNLPRQYRNNWNEIRKIMLLKKPDFKIVISKEIRLELPAYLHDLLVEEQEVRRNREGRKTSLASIISAILDHFLLQRDIFHIVDRIINEEKFNQSEQDEQVKGTRLTKGEKYYKALEEKLSQEKEYIKAQKYQLNSVEKALINEKNNMLILIEKNTNILNEIRNERASFVKMEQEHIHLKLMNSYLENEISEKKARFSSLSDDLSKLQRTIERIEKWIKRNR